MAIETVLPFSEAKAAYLLGGASFAAMFGLTLWTYFHLKAKNKISRESTALAVIFFVVYIMSLSFIATTEAARDGLLSLAFTALGFVNFLLSWDRYAEGLNLLRPPISNGQWNLRDWQFQEISADSLTRIHRQLYVGFCVSGLLWSVPAIVKSSL